MPNECLIDLNKISEGCLVVKLIHDNRAFPIDAIIEKANENIVGHDLVTNTPGKKKLSEIYGDTPSFSYALKIMDYVVRNGKSRSYIDYWAELGHEVVVDCLKLGENQCILVVRSKRKTTEKEFFMNQENEKMKMEIYNRNDFFLSTFSISIEDGFELGFINFPKDLDLKTISKNDLKEEFIKNHIHPDDLSFFESRYRLQNIIAETSDGGEWVTEIRRKCGNEYRYVKCMIKKSLVKDDLFFGWEYDTTSEHIIDEVEKNKDGYIGLYAKALESVGKKFYAIYGVDVTTKSIIMINKNEDISTILFEEHDQNENIISVHSDYIHPDDSEKVLEFFNLKKLNKQLEEKDETLSIVFRRIIDWKYQWVRANVTKLYNSGKEIVLFSFENINEEVIQKEFIAELLDIFKDEYMLNISIDLFDMTYLAEWKDSNMQSFEDQGNYVELYNRIASANKNNITPELENILSPKKLVENFNTSRKSIEIDSKLKINNSMEIGRVKVFYGAANDRRMAYVLVKKLKNKD